MTISEAELAKLAGSTVLRVREMVSLGILEPDAEGGFRPPDLQRIRIAEALDRAGMQVEQIGAMIADGSYSTGWADLLFPEPVPTSDVTFEEACDRFGIPLPMAQRMFTVAWQLAAPEPEDPLREDDVELLQILAMMYPLMGFDDDAVLASARYFGDNLRRMAESQMRFFRSTFEEPMIASGMSQREVMDLITQVGAPLVPVGYRVADLLYRRHLEHFEIEDIVTNTEIAMRQAGLSQARPEHTSAIAFCDVTDSTGFTAARGDEAAARMADRLGDVARQAASRHGGHVVKLLGDGAMFHFHGPAGAARCGLELASRADEEGLPPLRMGVHAGPVVFRDGDYFGRTVITAARVADRIGAGEVVLTAEAVGEVSSGDLTFDPLGATELKGLPEPVELFRARAS
jgi:adenylate cyclase